jgi:hypothetical protein
MVAVRTQPPAYRQGDWKMARKQSTHRLHATFASNLY